MAIKPCTGCKYLVAGVLCKATYKPEPWEVREPPFYDLRLQHGLSILQEVTRQRGVNGPCGPDAKLYEPDNLTFIEWVAGILKGHGFKWIP